MLTECCQEGHTRSRNHPASLLFKEPVEMVPFRTAQGADGLLSEFVT